jgi:hypothetical protein
MVGTSKENLSSIYKMPSKYTFLYNKSNPFGILEDVKLLSKYIPTPLLADPLEPPVQTEVLVHFEIPIYSWMAWASVNVVMVNPEWWEAAWEPYLRRIDFFLFKCKYDAEYFCTLYPSICSEQVIVLPWTTQVDPKDFPSSPQSSSESCLWLLGGSHSKREAALHILPLWKDSFPPLTVYTTSSLVLPTLASNIQIIVKDLSPEKRRELQASHRCHLIFSKAEAFGLSAAEAQAAGAFLLGNALPTYKEQYGQNPMVYLVPATLDPLKASWMDTFSNPNLQTLLEDGIQQFQSTPRAECYTFQKQQSTLRSKGFHQRASTLLQLFTKRTTSPVSLPPILYDADLPCISIVTLLYNRRKFLDLCFHTLLTTDYPKEKIEWILVEDSDLQDEQASDKIMKFSRECAPLSLSYIPLQKKHTIGQKRNIAVKRAQHSILLMMDDDDHYPATSFRRRVSWLLQHPWKPQATVCTMIACYDLRNGISAVNTPPWTLPLCQRISEATLTFTKGWWEAQQFPSTDSCEGEGFLAGRESDVLELPPQQIIVAMSHGKSASSRRIPPASSTPSCFWGFPKEFLTFLHGLVDVQIDEVS